MKEEVQVWGAKNDVLPKDVVVAIMEPWLDDFKAMVKDPDSVRPAVRLVEVKEAVRIYEMILKDPIGFDRNKVRRAMAALPGAFGAKPLAVDKFMAVHIGVAYVYADYSHLLPKNVAAEFKVLPVRVYRRSERDRWQDATILKVVDKASIGIDDTKRGVYTSCVGIATTIGGSVRPCPHKDEVRIMDLPRIRCSRCAAAFQALRAKNRRSNSPSAVDDKGELDRAWSKLV